MKQNHPYWTQQKNACKKFYAKKEASKEVFRTPNSYRIAGFFAILSLYIICAALIFSCATHPCSIYKTCIVVLFTAIVCWDSYYEINLLWVKKIIVHNNELLCRKSLFQYDCIKLEDITNCTLKHESRSHKTILTSGEHHLLYISYAKRKRISIDVSYFSKKTRKELVEKLTTPTQ